MLVADLGPGSSSYSYIQSARIYYNGANHLNCPASPVHLVNARLRMTQYGRSSTLRPEWQTAYGGYYAFACR